MQIPFIDIAPLLTADSDDLSRQEVIRQIDQACREIGFLTITGTGIEPATIFAMRQMVETVFSCAEADKERQMITPDNYRGYIPLGFFTPNDGTGKADAYEGFKLHQETAPDDPICQECALYGPNRWAEHAFDMQQIVLKYWQSVEKVGLVLLTAMEKALGLSDGALTEPFKKPLTNMTLLHYPPAAPDAGGFGIHPHKDTDALTLIAHDPVGGLDVRGSDGQWIAAACPEDGFIVNIGDMLETWTGGRYVSTPHRVRNDSGKERYSFPLFLVPRHDVTVHPLIKPLSGFQYEPVNAGHWSAEIWRTNWPDQIADETTPALGVVD